MKKIGAKDKPKYLVKS